MVQVKAGIQTDYVIEVAAEVEAVQDDHVADDLNLQIVGIEEFILRFKQRFPDSPIEPEKLWHRLFGNPPHADETTSNKDVCYLTAESCDKLLEHFQLFNSGIDFQHLPSGFFLTKNPNSGIRNVLHYSDYVATHTPQIDPLAITLSQKPGHEEHQDHHFPHPQSLWYEFLRRKMRGGDTTYCSEQELRRAFVTFSHILERNHLTFYASDFAALNGDFNPIVLLGRWATVLTQPNLKKEDLQIQWQELPNLQLTQGYGALRAITDYHHSDRPCGFLLPQMFLDNTRYSFIQTVHDVRNIYFEDSFWRYLSYQPKRNSIDFYQKALQKIELMDIRGAQKEQMRQILAASTSGRGHVAETLEEEKAELKIWSSFCKTIDTVTNASTTLLLVAQLSGGSEVIKNNFIHHLNRLTILPNILFLRSIAECIRTQLSALNVAGVLADKALGKDPMWRLIELSDKLNTLILKFSTQFYEGARFYFVDGKWNSLDLQQYIELQDHLNTQYFSNSPATVRLLLPHLSTFRLSNQQEIEQISQSLSNVTESREDDLSFCLSLFKEAVQQQDQNRLQQIINDLPQRSGQSKSLVPIIDFVQTHFADAFAPDYLAHKRQQLLDAELGLNDEQKLNVQQLNLNAEQTEAIIKIESALVRINNQINTPQLNRLNEHFVRLSRIFAPADFTEFTLRLVTIRESLPANPETLEKLLELIATQRSFESFNQIFFRNKIEKCTSNNLINKFNFYIEFIKPLGKAQGTINSQNIQDLLAMLILNCTDNSLIQASFVNDVKDILQCLKEISEAHPHIQEHLLQAFTRLADKKTDRYFENVLTYMRCIDAMARILQAGDHGEAQKNMLTFFTTLANFQQQPMELIALWQQIAILKDAEQQKFFLGMANSLLQNKQGLDGFAELIKEVKQNPELYDVLAEECAHPPYPAINKIRAWLLAKDSFQAKYQAFSMRPYGKRRLDFAFQRHEFDTQKPKFIGVPADLFTDEVGNALEQQIKHNRTLSVQTLREAYAGLKVAPTPLSPEQKLELLCICIEMLARTTAQLDDSTPPKRISQEVNTTQVMALYAMQMHENPKLISENDTGEGKSRIMMIHAACEALTGTVDVMTSDMPLAERDYLAYNALFTALGIRTSLISLNTPKELYQKGGVNFSDNSQLLLLRNRSDITSDPHAYLEAEPTARRLLIDEVDKFTHDKSKDSYNYAAKSTSLVGFIWIYPLLVRFVRQKLEGNPDSFDATALTAQFVDFVAANDIDQTHQASVASLNDNNDRRRQLVTWLNSARTALSMKVDDTYKVTDADDAKLFAIRDTQGYLRYTRKVLVLDGGRPVEGSTYSDGVHQCLCAIENEKAGKEDAFMIQPENATQRTSYPVSFMSKYAEGKIFGTSGTTRREGPVSSPEINYENFDYMRVPRQKELRRKDQNIWPAKDKTQQLEFIKRCIIDKQRSSPEIPVLLFAKNDEQSKEIYDALTTDKEFGPLMRQAVRVHALTEKADEVTAIAEAGQPDRKTVSTAGMFARGVDIHASDMLVLCAFVPTFEDEQQIKGRTGRYGKAGEYRMIPNLADPDCPLNGNTYNIHNEVDVVQKGMALNAVRQEEISKLYADFLENIHQMFLAGLSKKEGNQRLPFLKIWQKYLNDLQKAWDLKRKPLLEAIEAGQENEFKRLFREFTQSWKLSAESFIKGEAYVFNAEQKASIIYTALSRQQVFFQPQHQPLKVQRRYDKADDGQARIYSTLFAQERAILRGERPLLADFRAWKDGRGDLFPDLMATLRGERPLFANLRATIARLIDELVAWVKQRGEPELPPPVIEEDTFPIGDLAEEAAVSFINYGGDS